MALPFSINKIDAMVVFMNRCKQIAIYSKPANTIVAAFSLKNPDTGNKCRVGLWADNTSLFVDWAAVPAAHVTPLTVDFTQTEGDLWSDDGNIVIGVGDIRDGVIPATMQKFNLKNVGVRGLVIEHINDNVIKIYSTINPTSVSINVEINTCNV